MHFSIVSDSLCDALESPQESRKKRVEAAYPLPPEPASRRSRRQCCFESGLLSRGNQSNYDVFLGANNLSLDTLRARLNGSEEVSEVLLKLASLCSVR